MLAGCKLLVRTLHVDCQLNRKTFSIWLSTMPSPTPFCLSAATKQRRRVPSAHSFRCYLYSQLFTYLSILKQADDDEVVDPYPAIREECKLKCPKPLGAYDACVKRITDSGVGDCEAWYMELVNCQEKCAAPKIFKLTKGG